MVFRRNYFLIGILLLCAPVIHAYTFSDYLNRIGKKTLSLQHLCMYSTLYPFVFDTVHQQVQDEIMWQKGPVELHTHDVCDLSVSILLEICYATICGLRNDQLQEHIVLTIYGALLHKCLQQLVCACGLQTYVSDEVKKRYHLYGSNYVKALLACVCSEYINPTKY